MTTITMTLHYLPSLGLYDDHYDDPPIIYRQSIGLKMSRHEDYDYLFKIVMIGDSGVGKTNLLSRFVDGTFNVESKPTIGVEFATKTLTVQNKVVKNQIWDTAGQERFRAITNAYYQGAVGAILTFDLTKSRTYENVVKWLNELKDNASPDIVIMLLGNKSDLPGREIKADSVEEFVQKHNLLYLETSALNGANVDQAFEVLIKAICDKKKTMGDAPKSEEKRILVQPTPQAQPIKLKSAQEPLAQKQKKKCC